MLFASFCQGAKSQKIDNHRKSRKFDIGRLSIRGQTMEKANKHLRVNNTVTTIANTSADSTATPSPQSIDTSHKQENEKGNVLSSRCQVAMDTQTHTHTHMSDICLLMAWRRSQHIPALSAR